MSLNGTALPKLVLGATTYNIPETSEIEMEIEAVYEDYSAIDGSYHRDYLKNNTIQEENIIYTITVYEDVETDKATIDLFEGSNSVVFYPHSDNDLAYSTNISLRYFHYNNLYAFDAVEISIYIISRYYVAFDNFINYYRLEEITGTNIKDVKSGNNGTATADMSTLTSSTGKNNKCWEGDGTNYITIPNSLGDGGGNAMSIGLWIKTVALQVNLSFFGVSKTGNNPAVALRVNGNVLQWYIGSWQTLIAVLDHDAWYNIVITFRASDDHMVAYVDSVNTANGTNTAYKANTESIFIGDIPLVAGGTSKVDELAIWNIELTQDQIDEFYNSGAGVFY